LKGRWLGGGGRPADQAGLQKADAIIKVAGQTTANICDYTYALDVLKIGQSSQLVYLQNGARHGTMLTPAARE